MGLVVSRLIFNTLGVSPPRLPDQAPESIAIYYLLAGSIALTIGTVLTARGLRGTRLVRWSVLAMFVFVGFGVSSTIETSIFSSANGVILIVPILFLPCILLAGVEVCLLRPRDATQLPRTSPASFFRSRTWTQWMWRFAASVFAFPLVYFLFGLIVSPVVTKYYESGSAGLALPGAGQILSTQLVRGILHLVVTLPVMILWSTSRRQLIAALTLAFFVFVASYDIVLAYRVPSILLITHGFEVLASSFVYAWLLVTFLVQKGFHD
jgi:hypothetical protein